MSDKPTSTKRKSISSGYIFPKIIFNFSKASFSTFWTHIDPNHQIPLKPPDPVPNHQILTQTTRFPDPPDPVPDHQIPSQTTRFPDLDRQIPRPGPWDPDPSQTSDSSSKDHFWDPQMTPDPDPAQDRFLTEFDPKPPDLATFRTDPQNSKKSKK